MARGATVVALAVCLALGSLLAAVDAGFESAPQAPVPLAPHLRGQGPVIKPADRPASHRSRGPFSTGDPHWIVDGELPTPTTPLAEYQWMLTDEEMTRSRGGEPRDGLENMSMGNEMLPLMDGINYMTQLYSEMEATRKGDYIHGQGFDWDGSVVMAPDSGKGQNAARRNIATTVHATLLRAISRGVHVRILANKNLYLGKTPDNFCAPLNKVCNKGLVRCCVPDDRHNSATGSLHTKMWVISRKSMTVGFVGGIDLGAGRWDTEWHQGDKVRNLQPKGKAPFFGWHDNMYRIRGPAVIDLARHFYDRWNDERSPSSGFIMPFAWVPPSVSRVASSSKIRGGLSMQVLRTISCKGSALWGYYADYAPLGEFSFRDAFAKMVRNAKEYIYIEDQFVFYPEAMEIVREALPRVKKVIIVTDTSNSWTTTAMGASITFLAVMRGYYQTKAFNVLLRPDADGTVYRDKIHSFELVRPGGSDANPSDIIYTHSKNYLVDDEFMITGSAGFERAGFVNEEEVAVGVYDRQHGKGPFSFVGTLRRTLMAHYLGGSGRDKRLNTVEGAVKRMEIVAKAPGSKLRRYWPQSPLLERELAGETGVSISAELARVRFVYEKYEADGECTPAETMGIKRKLVGGKIKEMVVAKNRGLAGTMATMIAQGVWGAEYADDLKGLAEDQRADAPLGPAAEDPEGPELEPAASAGALLDPAAAHRLGPADDDCVYTCFDAGVVGPAVASGDDGDVEARQCVLSCLRRAVRLVGTEPAGYDSEASFGDEPEQSGWHLPEAGALGGLNPQDWHQIRAGDLKDLPEESPAVLGQGWGEAVGGDDSNMDKSRGPQKEVMKQE